MTNLTGSQIKTLRSEINNWDANCMHFVAPRCTAYHKAPKPWHLFFSITVRKGKDSWYSHNEYFHFSLS